MGSLRSASRDENEVVGTLLNLLNLSSLADRPALGLPLGSARLVELGRALASEPAVLLLDEPSSGLDSHETSQFEDAITRVTAERDLSVLLVEHDVDLVMRMCSHIYVLDFGELIGSGSPEEVRRNPAVQAAYLGDDELEEFRGVEDRGPSLVDPLQEVRIARPEDISANLVSSPRDEAMPTAVLEVSGLDVHYGDAVALSNVSITIQRGRVLAVLGANGAGKSSLARSISGLVRPTAGHVLFAGEEITQWPSYRIRRAGLMHLPEGRGVFREFDCAGKSTNGGRYFTR